MSRPKSLARRSAIQALYQWQLTGQSASDIEKQFIETRPVDKVHKKYFNELLSQTIKHIEALDEKIAPTLDRPIKEVNPVECSIIRMSTYELMYRPELPYRVIINEGVELAKVFGADKGHKFINGVLDKLAHQIRPEEVAIKRSAKKPST
ncbi:MAG: transcription antitermination factor NusB [Gammaproteobacteria bacterium]|nr:transcription antitermination factor NusB [Gammaproteobacteria bacterium]